MCIYWKIWDIILVFNPNMWVYKIGLCLLPRIAEDNLWVKNEQNCHFRHYFYSNCYNRHVLCIWLVATLKGGGEC